MKITGAEFMDWYDQAWPGDEWLHEDSIETHDNNGEWILEADKIYDTNDFGYLIAYQGDDKSRRLQSLDIDKCIKHWRMKLQYDYFIVTVPKQDAEEFLAYCKDRGWKNK